MKDTDATAAAIEKLRAALEANPRAVPVLVEEAIAMLEGDAPFEDRDLPSFHRGYTAGYEKAKADSVSRSHVRPELRAFALVYDGAIQRLFIDKALADKFHAVAKGELVPMVGHRGPVA